MQKWLRYSVTCNNKVTGFHGGNSSTVYQKLISESQSLFLPESVRSRFYLLVRYIQANGQTDDRTDQLQ